MTWRCAALVLLSACSEAGLTVDVSAKSDVPALDTIRVQVSQDPLLVEQSFGLGGKALPQSVAIVSRGLTMGKVDVVVQGLANGRVEAIAKVSGELRPALTALRVAAVLERLCPAGSPMCGCTPLACGANSCGQLDDGCGGKRSCKTCPAAETCQANVCQPAGCRGKTCAELGAGCGFTVDGCGRTIDCGTCDAGFNCGGGGAANVCGPGTCTPRTGCDAGMECGSSSDGCGNVLACGTCDAGVCGADGMANRCPCVPLTSCPANTCGMIPNGCGTGSVTCPSSCNLPDTCGGGDAGPNGCGCTRRACGAFDCGTQSDGCGGMLNCGFACTGGRICGSLDGGPTRCNCGNASQTECNGTCVSLSSSATNCGACGRACPSGQSCRGGLCPCVDAGSNNDGHCCPQGWSLQRTWDGSHLRCFLFVDGGTEAEGAARCRAETTASYGYPVMALGWGLTNDEDDAVPTGACGNYLLGNNDRVLDVESSGVTSRPCQAGCTASNCTCTQCSCNGLNRACSQRYYCVMEPLGPTVEGACQQGAECPPGKTCTSGNCVDAGRPPCVLAADCAPQLNACVDRGNTSQTGLCQ